MPTEICSDTLIMSFQNLWGGVIGFAPKIIVAIIIFVIGLLIASIIGRFVDKIIRSLRVDKAFQSVGVDEMLHKGGFTLNSGHFIGGLGQWRAEEQTPEPH